MLEINSLIAQLFAIGDKIAGYDINDLALDILHIMAQ